MIMPNVNMAMLTFSERKICMECIKQEDRRKMKKMNIQKKKKKNVKFKQIKALSNILSIST